MKNFTKIFVSIFYIGYIRYASGTWGSLASLIILYCLFHLLTISLSFLISLFVFLFFLSNYLINYFSSFTNSHDSKHIVIDELLGLFLIFLFYDLLFIYNDFFTCLLIFIIFRIFDIYKVFPANYFDKKFYNGYGVILDDIVAALYTILTIMLINVFL